MTNKDVHLRPNDWSNILNKADKAAEALKQPSFIKQQGFASPEQAIMDKDEIVNKASKMLAAPVSYDPSPTAEAVANERLEHLLAGVTTTTLNELRELRDEIDNLMRIVQARHDTLVDACCEHVGYSTSTISCKEIIKENLSKISNDFKNGMDPIPKIVTVQSNGEDKSK